MTRGPSLSKSRHDASFAVAKIVFAVARENIRDGHAGGPFDLAIRVDEIQPKPSRQARPVDVLPQPINPTSTSGRRPSACTRDDKRRSRKRSSPLPSELRVIPYALP